MRVMFELARELGHASPALMMSGMRPSEFGLWCALLQGRLPSLPEMQALQKPKTKAKPLDAMRAWFGHLVKPKEK